MLVQKVNISLVNKGVYKQRSIINIPMEYLKMLQLFKHRGIINISNMPIQIPFVNFGRLGLKVRWAAGAAYRKQV
jgi:hypothetical protein